VQLAQLQLVSEQGAQGEVGRVYAEIRETLGISFVPNFFKTLANSPTALRATWEAYRNNSWRGTIPTVLKEMMFVAISTAGLPLLRDRAPGLLQATRCRPGDSPQSRRESRRAGPTAQW
jgi:hypothetical protein